MNFLGLIIAVISFVIIGVFHPLVVKGEYYFSAKIWPLFLAFGLIFLIISCYTQNTIISAALGVLGCSSLWSIGELKEQERRVKKGWFPENPKRKIKPAASDVLLENKTK